MPLSLLQTKLYRPPPRAKRVERSHLITRLSVGGVRPFTLVSAPAGFGKTTLVSAWLAEVSVTRNALQNDRADDASIENPYTVAWLALDEDDNDPTRFLTYLIAALQTQQPSLGESALALLRAPQAPSAKNICTLVINDVIALATPLLLVLDDYHLITTPAIHEALTFLLDHLPPNLHLVLTTRADPPLPLSRWRVRHQLLEIRAADLRFSAAEAAIFLNEIMNLALSAAEIARLDTRTEGWIAGLQLAALSMQGHQDVHGFVNAFAGSNHYIMDYLLEEVLRQLPPATLDFLLQTSILARFCGALCDAVTGRTDGQAMLEQLQRRNLFLIPLDHERRWYRYHHLFDEMLRNYLSQAQVGPTAESPSKTNIAALHDRASQWWQENGFIDAAIDHALAAQAFDQAALLIDQSYMLWLASGQVVTLQRWLDAFPAAMRQSQPTLNLAQAWIHLNAGRVQAAQTCTQAAEAALVQLPETQTSVHNTQIALAVTLAFIANLSASTPQTIAQAEVVLTELAPDQMVWRSRLSNVLAFAYYWQGNMPAAGRLAHAGLALAQAMGTRNMEVSARGVIGAICEMGGHLQEAETWLQQSIQLGTFEGKVLPTTAIAAGYVAIGRMHYQQHRWHESADCLDRAIEISTQLQDVIALHVALICRVRTLHSQGNYEAALAHLQRLQALPTNNPSMPLKIEAMRALIWLDQGEIGRVRAWLTPDLLNAIDSARPTDLRKEAALLPVAEVLIRLGSYALAARLLQRLDVSARQGERLQSVIQILVLQTMLAQQQGDRQGALAGLEQAVRLGEPSGYIAFFVEQGAVMRTLLAALHPALLEPTIKIYVARLLTMFDEGEAPRQARLANDPIGNLSPKIQNLLEPLSDRELEILRLVNTGLSNSEIAAKLIVTVGTVKKHLNNIFGKLGVNSRTQAIVRAREVKLLE